MDNYTDVYDEEQFTSACSEMDLAVSGMSDVTSACSSVSVPSDFSSASAVTSVIGEINGNLQTKMDNYATTFLSLKATVSGKDITPQVVLDENGEVEGFVTSNGYVSLSNFDVTYSTNGTYYSWTGGEGSNIKNACDIYIPNVTTLEGVTIYFAGLGGLSADPNVREIKAGNIKTNGIIVIPTNCYTLNDSGSSYVGFTQAGAESLAEDAKNIASTFGVSTENINVYGFSAGGGLAGSLVSRNPDNTFNTVVLASTSYSMTGITDPSINIITIVGEAEAAGNSENYNNILNKYEKYTETHSNECEFYIVPQVEEGVRVSHGRLTGAAAATDIFGGEGIFEYINSKGEESSQTVSTSTGTEQPSVVEEIPTVSSGNIETVVDGVSTGSSGSTSSSTVSTGSSGSTSSSSTSTGSSGSASSSTVSTGSSGSTSSSTVSTGSSGSTSSSTVSTGSSGGTSSSTVSTGSSGSSSTSSTSTGSSGSTLTSSQVVNILPSNNSFSEKIPMLATGSLESMEINSQGVRYEINSINDTAYNNYLSKLEDSGFTLSEDGTYWMKDNYKLILTRESNNLMLTLGSIVNI